MPVFNYAKKEVNVKVVYYGPGLSGKTTNLQKIHEGVKPEFKGKLVSLATQTDRTLFFDFMPLELGSLGGYKVRLHLYTVPGQVHYNATRKLVLKGVDGVVFVADSQRAMADANVESFFNLEKNLLSYGKVLAEMPHVIQANKRDLDEALPLEELRALLNRYGAPLKEAVASEGEGVLETLSEIVRMVMRGLKDQFRSHASEVSDTAPATLTAQEQTPPPAAVPEPATAPVPDPATEQPRVTGSEPLQGPSRTAAGEPEVDPGRYQDLDLDQEERPVAAREPDTVDTAAMVSEPAAEPASVPETGAAATGAAQPILVTVPVEGVGTLELSIAVTARLVEGDGTRSVDVAVEEAAVEKVSGTDIETGKGTGIGTGKVTAVEPEGSPEIEPVAGSESGTQPAGEIGTETESETLSDSQPLPPLGEESDEPVGAPLDGQEEMTVSGFDTVADTVESPGTDLEAEPEAGFSGDEKILFDEDAEGSEGVSEGQAENESMTYDPSPQPIDLFADTETETPPEEPAPKKKGLFGRWKKK